MNQLDQLLIVEKWCDNDLDLFNWFTHLFCIPDIHIESLPGFIGVPVVQRFGVNGHICNDGFTKAEADVVCKERGYAQGILLKATTLNYVSFVVQNLKCRRSERKISDCKFSTWSLGSSCSKPETPKLMCLKNMISKIF